jgi:hypothetical protein
LQQHAYNHDHDALMTDDGDDGAATPRAITDEEPKEYEQSDADESVAGLDPLAASYQTCSFEESDDEDDSEPSHAPTAGPSGAAKGPDDPSNEVDHGTEPFTVSELETGMAAFINKHRLSRPAWPDLLAVLRLIRPLPDEIERLPKRVDTLKNKFKKHLPLLLMRKATLLLDPRKLPTRAQHTNDLYLFDMSAVFARMLQSQLMMVRGHFSIAKFVDEPVKFYHSEA